MHLGSNLSVGKSLGDQRHQTLIRVTETFESSGPFLSEPSLRGCHVHIGDEAPSVCHIANDRDQVITRRALDEVRTRAVFVRGDERIVGFECSEDDDVAIGTIGRDPLDELQPVGVTESHVDESDVVVFGELSNCTFDRGCGSSHVDVLFGAECEGQSLREEIVVVAQEDPNCSRRDFQGASPPDDRTGPYANNTTWSTLRKRCSHRRPRPLGRCDT